MRPLPAMRPFTRYDTSTRQEYLPCPFFSLFSPYPSCPLRFEIFLCGPCVFFAPFAVGFPLFPTTYYRLLIFAL